MKLRVVVTFCVAALIAAITLPSTLFAQDKEKPEEKKVVVAWSVWTGWMPFKIMQEQGFLAKRNKEFGVNVELKEFKEYMASVQAYTAGQVDGVTLTSMEALQPASAGVKTVAVLPNDTSNGGDGILVRKGTTIAGLKGKKILLEQNSVSHFLLYRALANNNMSESDVTIVNMPGDEAGKAFLTDDTVEAVVTWNPHLFLAEGSGKGEVIFSSRDIPGEIVDLTVFNEKIVRTNPNAVRALCLAWFDAMAYIDGKDTREDAIQIMADGAGTTPEEFKKMMVGTKFFRDADKASKFFDSPELKDTLDRVKAFCIQKELITDKNLEIGWSKNSDAPLRLNPEFLDTAQGEKRANRIENSAGKIGNKFDRAFGRKESK